MEPLRKAAYQFGNTVAAGDRLQLLADVFQDSTTSFLQRIVTSPPTLALDLGSGPGLSTALLQKVTGAHSAIGLESSMDFVAAARARFGVPLAFVQHDVTNNPFPTPKADLIYCRFLLTHLQNPHDVVAVWTAPLHRLGLLLMEEVEFIATEDSRFNRYLVFVEELLASQRQRLFVGSELKICQPAGTELVSSHLCAVPVPRRDAATLALMNLAHLRRTEWAQAHYEETWFDDLARELDVFRRAIGEPVVWGLRQHALRKTARHQTFGHLGERA